VCPSAYFERLIDFECVGLAEFARVQTASSRDDEAGGCGSGCVERLAGEVLEDLCDGFPTSRNRGRASSFCSSSKRSAARAELKDFRLRLPVRSLQSA